MFDLIFDIIYYSAWLCDMGKETNLMKSWLKPEKEKMGIKKLNVLHEFQSKNKLQECNSGELMQEAALTSSTLTGACRLFAAHSQ